MDHCAKSMLFVVSEPQKHWRCQYGELRKDDSVGELRSPQPIFRASGELGKFFWQFGLRLLRGVLKMGFGYRIKRVRANSALYTQRSPPRVWWESKSAALPPGSTPSGEHPD